MKTIFNKHFSAIFFFLTASLCSTMVKAQITYSDWWLNINNAAKHPNLPMTIGTWPGFYWTCNQSNFFMLDVSPSNPRIAGTGNEIVFYNTDKGIFNSIQVANVYNHSDARAKENVKTITSGLDAVLNLHPVSYNWKKYDPSVKLAKSAISDTTQAVSYGPDDKTLQYGFIAQEVEKVLPNVVKTNEDGHKMINYTAIIPVLVQAIQKLKSTVETQKIQIEQLIGNNTSFSRLSQNNKITSCSPNPANSNVAITTQLNANAKSAVLRISNLSGQMEKNIAIIPETATVSENIADLDAGMHIVSLIVNGTLCDSSRFIKE